VFFGKSGEIIEKKTDAILLGVEERGRISK
jgi:hypothetical protein